MTVASNGATMIVCAPLAIPRPSGKGAMGANFDKFTAGVWSVYHSYNKWPAPVRVVIALIVDFGVVNLAVYFWKLTGAHIESATVNALPWVHEGLIKLEGIGIITLYSLFLIELIRKIAGAFFGEAIARAYTFLKEKSGGSLPAFAA